MNKKIRSDATDDSAPNPRIPRPTFGDYINQ